LSSKRGPEENSGLIDLDSLLREARESERNLPAAAASSPAVASPVASSPAVSPPAPPALAAPPAPVSFVPASLPPTVREPKPRGRVEREAPPAQPVVAREVRPRAGPVVEAPPARREAVSSTGITAVMPTESGGSGSLPRTLLIAVAAAAILAFGATRLLRDGAESTSPRTSAKAPALATAASPAAPPTAVDAPPAPGLDPSMLPVADAKGASALPSGPAPTRLAAGARDRAQAQAQPTAKVTETDLAPVAGSDADLGNAMRSAVGPRSDTAAQAEGPQGNGARQLRPSPGAVVGAINSVLPAARACLGPDDPVRSGAVVFRSDGSVSRVDLRGAKAEDGCLQSALSKARVEPFSDDSFTTRVTVRP